MSQCYSLLPATSNTSSCDSYSGVSQLSKESLYQCDSISGMASYVHRVVVYLTLQIPVAYTYWSWSHGNAMPWMEKKNVSFCNARIIFLTISILSLWLVHLRNLSKARRMIYLHDLVIRMCQHTGDGCYVHMMMSLNGNNSALLALCEGNSPITGEFTSQRPVTRSFDVFFYLRLNKRLRKPSRHRWFETPLCSIWRHCNDITHICVWPIDMI